MIPLILVVDDDVTLNRLMVGQLNRMGYAATGVHSWAAAQAYLQQHDPHLVLLDCQLPDARGRDVLPQLVGDCPVIIITAYGSVKEAVGAMQAGAAEYLLKPVNLDELQLVIRKVLDAHSMKQEFLYLKEQVQKRKSFMVGQSPALKEVENMIGAVAPSMMTVLIQGESGVGKELVAREIHERSQVASRSFVALDCCTMQENLFESELFGHEKGAFTGADRQKKGLIESAEGGTLFLDEIGEITPAIQAKLLRVLETGRFRRLGGTRDMTANVRVVAATNRDLLAMSQEGTFRADLFYRLNAFTIYVPPLRQRREDIPALVKHFINNHDFSRRVNKHLSEEALAKLVAYPWPGNIRELKNMVERAIILSGDTARILPGHIMLSDGVVATVAAPASKGVSLDFEQIPTLEDLEKHYLHVLLDKFNGHRGKVARTLGISERNVYRLLKKYEFMEA
ncbi:sigma-54-dependent transcriptional regulator [Thiothrix winogradskyi]|uniref:Sigma-54 dependent transcriptional regulator n=1 Tax=Thiothrix winogradskyi TaxID=96472 RepID=A0ABY3T3E7_9GAMM|nr:sigma-54 dependent transcriptional regulator [Thiothrix winogradskyi]UJS25314.1 sigma-54 dependent transcriptional regulator [Thiothrix winogradskyi]